MTTSHTPAPWGISSQSPNIVKQYDGFGETNVIIGSASGYPKSGFYPDDETALANARLICAAPDLLEALRGLANECELAGHGTDKDYGWPKWMKAARDAITKATGD